MRYKVLVRERDRLADRGQTDSEIDAEIAKILEEFPNLVETKTTVSQSTQQMLAFAETMAGDDPAPGPATTQLAPSAVKAAEDAAKPTDKQTEVPSLPRAKGETGDATTTSASPVSLTEEPSMAAASSPKQPQTKEEKERGERSLARALLALRVVTTIVRMWYDSNAKVTFPPVDQMKIILGAVASALLHLYVVQPCSFFGRLADPSFITAGMHLQFVLTTSLAATHRSRLERIVVYFIREFIPSLCCCFMFYCLTMSFATLAFKARPTYFCFS